MCEERFNFDSLGYVFAFVKMFKYFAIHIKLQIIAVTLSKASNLIVSWLILFLCLFTSFTVVAHQTWGRQMEDFQSIASSMRTMLFVMLGNIPYAKMYAIRPTFTPGFAICFYITINYVMLNMLVSILHYQYGNARHVIAKFDSVDVKISKRDMQKARDMSVTAILNILCPVLAYRKKKK